MTLLKWRAIFFVHLLIMKVQKDWRFEENTHSPLIQCGFTHNILSFGIYRQNDGHAHSA
jgi:hypothetical protein